MSGPVQRAATISLETIAAMGDDEPVSLPASGLTRDPALQDIVGWGGGGGRGGPPGSYTTPRDMIALSGGQRGPLQ